ncbi:hypothetical protein MMC20_005255 [Loxospora ochrophaea]|nr:hypothetical protein [Loxospora ochrophaea]
MNYDASFSSPINSRKSFSDPQYTDTLPLDFQATHLRSKFSVADLSHQFHHHSLQPHSRLRRRPSHENLHHTHPANPHTYSNFVRQQRQTRPAASTRHHSTTSNLARVSALVEELLHEGSVDDQTFSPSVLCVPTPNGDTGLVPSLPDPSSLSLSAPSSSSTSTSGISSSDDSEPDALEQLRSQRMYKLDRELRLSSSGEGLHRQGFVMKKVRFRKKKALRKVRWCEP